MTRPSSRRRSRREPLDALLGDQRVAAADEPLGDVLRAMHNELVHPVSDTAATAAGRRLAAAASVLEPVVSPPARLSWRARTGQLLAATTAKVIATTVAAAAATGGLAATGALPEPVTQAVAAATRPVANWFSADPGDDAAAADQAPQSTDEPLVASDETDASADADPDGVSAQAAADALPVCDVIPPVLGVDGGLGVDDGLGVSADAAAAETNDTVAQPTDCRPGRVETGDGWSSTLVPGSADDGVSAEPPVPASPPVLGVDEPVVAGSEATEEDPVDDSDEAPVDGGADESGQDESGEEAPGQPAVDSDDEAPTGQTQTSAPRPRPRPTPTPSPDPTPTETPTPAPERVLGVD